jgi:hypothetical protein
MKNILAILAVIFVGVILYGLTLRGSLGNPAALEISQQSAVTKPFESSHERAPYGLILSLIENKSYALSQELANVAAPDAAYYNGNFYILFPPGESLISIPFYLLGRNFNAAQLVTYASSALFAILTMIFLYLICRKTFGFVLWVSLTVPLIYGFGTTSWSYAITIYQHSATAFLVVSGFYGAWLYSLNKRASWLGAVWTWIAYGVAMLLDYPNAILMAPIMIYLFLSAVRIKSNEQRVGISFRSSFLLTAIVFVVITVGHGYFNYKSYGDWKKISQSFTRYKDKDELDQIIAKVDAEKAKTGEVKRRSVTSVLQENRIVNGLYTLTIASDKGIFFYSPVLLLALLGIWIRRKEITLASGTLLAVILTDFFIYSSFGDPWGGWAYGPRYLVPSMALLAVFVGVWLQHTKHRVLSKLFFFLLFAYSSAIGLLGVLTTNLIPPGVEAIPLNLKSNFMANFDLLTQGKTGSFAYANYFSRLPLVTYFVFIYGGILLLVTGVITVIPLLSARKKHEY